MTAGEAERGYNGVLINGSVPRRIIALGDVPIRRRLGDAPCSLPRMQPFFVFDQTEDEVLVGPIQHRNLAWGWVKKSEVGSWNTRRVLVDDDGKIRAFVRQDPARQRYLGATSGLKSSAPANCKVCELYSETEIDEGITGILRLDTAIKRVSLLNPRARPVLEQFIREHRAGVVDLSEIQRTLELLNEDDLESEEAEHQKRVLRQQTRLLLQLLREVGRLNSLHEEITPVHTVRLVNNGVIVTRRTYVVEKH